MPLDTYTKALKMLEYFGWPEELVATPTNNPKRFTWRNERGCVGLLTAHALAILQAHMWSIIGDRYDYDFNREHIHGKLCFRLDLLDKGTVHIVWDDGNADLDTLLVETCEWIKNREQEK